MSVFFEKKTATADAAQKPRRRAEIADEWKWDLTTIFPTEADWETAFAELESAVGTAEVYRGRLAETAQTLLAAIRKQEELAQQAGKLYVYAHLKYDEDTGNQAATAALSRVEGLLAVLSGAWSWMTPELTELSEEQLAEFLSEETGLTLYRRFFEEIRRAKPHILSDKEEAVLAKAGQILDANTSIFGVLNHTDFIFPLIEDADGEQVRLTHARYGKYMEDRNRRVRKEAFESYYSLYEQYRNTLATTLRGQVQTHNYLADLRGFASARERALFNNEIPEAVYDQLVATVRDHLPLLHDYIRLRRDRLELDELHCYDLYVPMAEDIRLKFSYPEACELVSEALRPMGEEYLEVVRTALSERWIDVYENVGKTSGGYSSGTYGTNPFILLNWRETLDMVYTLIHEIGHSVHSWYSRRHQPYTYSNYPIFLAEIASTTNENLLTRYLLDHETDPKVRAYIAGHYLDGFKGTVFRQTQFAEFEQLIHEEDQKGTALTADFLSQRYGELNQIYYGPDLVQDPPIRLEWSRIPHFYYNYYVYQYATGFSAATAFAEQILTGGPSAVKRYIGFLQAGSSAPPIDVLKQAGLDMTSDAPIRHALQTFARFTEELKG